MSFTFDPAPEFDSAMAAFDEHLVCVEHEDHDFSDAPIDVAEVGS
ncbi:hypothetical protein [Mycobacteroides abscessus]|uniref:Uncharacterized protein n=1 Tax=Mycobacteroides abscessus subsp. massiliense TaxID=1962118 RepID=A0A1U0ZTU1_9MYCO|nr:hypothetical protein [Mycobacteroides abscessus]SKM69368.1 Uncharacterised protein [Mycobacteroides abscessus subsp. massiliense]SKT69849.1 Uncharacterised protein [Mycobacteroides abscessus subsp. massiliense]SKT97427.1 Uncharacterised protein [Mycobacteroides abscessus subsp. massiliense]SKX42568.1 Uncharacterised protein [Mycobacteroides abscessus subsp. massiliense]